MRRTVEAMLVIAIVIDVAYWTIWFTQRDWLASEDTKAYYDFENAFPLADLWLGVACLLALVTLRRRHESTLFWLLCAGSASLYLFAMDFLYDVKNGIFFSGGGSAVEAVIVLLEVGFATTILTWTWRHRGELLSGREVGA
jgi:hypothetical protein